MICFRYETAIGILPGDPRGADPGDPLPVWKLPHSSGIRKTKEECTMRIPVSSFRPCQRDRAGKGKIFLSCDGPGTPAVPEGFPEGVRPRIALFAQLCFGHHFCRPV
ncbi:MAG: hypothetical protein C6W56_09110 [Caldibacillus debilis]|nr:MAG: hypothetical protein C6W56_09110 [Caldibacillus debilis]